VVGESDMLIVESPGAGGYGPPAERSQDAILTDQVSGKFSQDYIERWYGIARAAE
jgi:N-methylhydantoinase B